MGTPQSDRPFNHILIQTGGNRFRKSVAESPESNEEAQTRGFCSAKKPNATKTWVRTAKAKQIVSWSLGEEHGEKK
jgi:hypothetical protein